MWCFCFKETQHKNRLPGPYRNPTNRNSFYSLSSEQNETTTICATLRKFSWDRTLCLRYSSSTRERERERKREKVRARHERAGEWVREIEWVRERERALARERERERYLYIHAHDIKCSLKLRHAQMNTYWCNNHKIIASLLTAYEVATISKLLKKIGLLWKGALSYCTDIAAS